MSEVTKRSVSTDALETLGTIIGPGEKRDAIHLAVIPVLAGARLYPGQSIDAVDGIATPSPGGLGIVDPFLASVVLPEQRFWMVLRPRIVTSLRHVWSHPAFPDEVGQSDANVASDAKAAAMAELTRIAAECDSTVQQMIAGANDHLDRGDYLSEGGRWEGVCVPDDFWPHFETVTGRKVPNDDRQNFFGCAC